jgi:hypothetical protein
MAYFDPEGKWWWVEGTMRLIMVLCFCAAGGLLFVAITSPH